MGLYVIKFFIEIIGFDIIKKLRMIFFYELFYFGNQIQVFLKFVYVYVSLIF